MKIEEKVYASIGLTVFLTIAYYYVYSFVDQYLSKLCDKYVCFEFPPYADILALWVAIIGLYFVVTTLDSWKHQDKYNNAKNRIYVLNDLQQKITMSFSYKICAFYQTEKGTTESQILRYNYERDYIISCFKAYLDDTQILTDIRKIERENFNVKNCLYQTDFDIIIKHAYDYISGCINEIKALELTEDDSKDSYQNDLTQIYRRHRIDESLFKEKLKFLNEKLNKFIE